ncbi:hypothetical protein [Listeria monocytogenes]|uniref:hypothetical protein n=1 Tax=Listeria monocytogenes TaxID=1639 RepID=UPI000F0E1226|nr:hypothetical protein [Listeria monocytogenes]EAC8234908.1 hypothetical protein [Listeria monocytogenes]EAE7928086.1 hypothetical protein [Listeria monocytogenes]EAE8362930.1 hypothetical protein [Listeria monocytogenes]EAG3119317.1 hypothetical protein [Listeria monocytogenes]EBF5119657.1 hypothetical protein [Listeria monocytogenes]
MFTIRFEVEKNVRKLLRPIIKGGVDYELRTCNTILQEAEAILLQQGISSNLFYHIQEPFIPVSFRASVMLGEGRPMNILLLVNQTLNTVFTDKPEEEKNSLIHLLEQAFLEEERTTPEVKLEKKVIPESPPSIPVVEIQEEFPIKQTEEIISKPTKQLNKRPKRREWRAIISRFSSFFMFSRKVWIVLAVAIVVTSSVVLFSLMPSEASKTEAVKKTPSLEKLLKEEKLPEIARYYPEEWENIRLDYIHEANIRGLQEMNQVKPSALLDVDIAYFEKNYDQVVQLYEANKALKYAGIDYAFVGFSYLTEGNVKQAEVLNLYAEDPDLKAYIEDYKLTQSIVTETKQVLKRNDLTKELRTELEIKLKEAEKHIQDYHQGKVEVKKDGEKDTL